MVSTAMRGAAPAAVASSSDSRASAESSSRRVCVRRDCCARPESGTAQLADVEGVQPARVGAGEAEQEARQGPLLAGVAPLAVRPGDKSAGGAVFVVVEVGP